MKIITATNGKFKLQDGGVDFYKSSWLTSNAVTQFAHGLGSSPDNVELWYDDAGTIFKLDPGHLSYVDTTNINLNFSSLTVDATHKVKAIAYLL